MGKPRVNRTRARYLAVLFDFGGVLYRTPNVRRVMGLLRLIGAENASLVQMILHSPVHSPLVHKIFTGQVPEKHLWDELIHRFKMRPGLLRYLRRNSFSTDRLNQNLLGFLSTLRPHYKTAILTNAGDEFRETFCSAYPIEQWVDQVIISAEEGLCKPDPAIYKLASERVGVATEQIVFVDDLQENVVGARKAGMTAILHEKTSQTLTQLQSLLATA
jgi:epoxide hydrolase-like predicted phosphatase